MIKRLQSPTWRVLAVAGFLQALGVIAYCALIALVFTILDKFQVGGPGVILFTFFLLLFVFSAAITGFLVFGYAAYLALNQKVKEALMDLAYTLLWTIFLILVGVLKITILIYLWPSLFN
ncbi:MAG: hypothetical protein A2172_03605 [Candidatus Woykebacteria bacterium RBG_13_40_15]|uniref:Uncharacterized protein n=1 Tax=Candidatus Woykebacteria bacterium RBG_13_40_15 TaxID=1802593 RepID=A0A1G1W5M5_9BACT|nr:MAG: hypothetical protein A2172_03605 [Candidatus Woykebacteria bacterium RBG_13_40_15]